MSYSRNKVLIAGYLQEMEEKLQIRIPYDIRLVMYGIYFDTWSQQYSNNSLTMMNNDCIKTNNHILGKGLKHYFGNCVIKLNEKYTWTFKVSGIFGCIYVGVINDKLSVIQKLHDTRFAYNWGQSYKGYRFSTNEYVMSWIKWGNAGDIIEMTLDLTKNEEDVGMLSYKLNGNDYEEIYKLSNKEPYRLCVCLHDSCTNAQFQII